MRSLCKFLCFFMLFGLALGQIFSLGSMVYRWHSVSPCSSAPECQQQYIYNITNCWSYGKTDSPENLCGDAIDPAYMAVTGNWTTRLQKFNEIANTEKQTLAPEVLQAKQERIREVLKQKYDISSDGVFAAEAAFLVSIILPLICILVDWYLSCKARKILLQEAAPSTIIMLFIGLLFVGALCSLKIILDTPDFGSLALNKKFALGGIVVLLAGFAFLAAKGVMQEFHRFRVFARAVKKAK